MTSIKKKAENRQHGTEGTTLSRQIRDWAKGNDWYRTDIQTNQLRLEQTFGHAIETIAKDLDYQNQPRLRRQLFDCYDMLTAKCRQIDMVCRKGCCNEGEVLELEFLRGKAVAAAVELAEVLDLLKRTQEPRNLRTQEKLDSGSQAGMTVPEEWITFSQAADIIGVTKGTISKWAAEGKFRDNGQKGQQRRLLKTSVLMVKFQKEDEDLKKDVSDLRQDAQKLG